MTSSDYSSTAMNNKHNTDNNNQNASITNITHKIHNTATHNSNTSADNTIDDINRIHHNRTKKRKRGKVAARESDKVVTPPCPRPGALHLEVQLIRIVFAASSLPKEEPVIRWVRECWRKGARIEVLDKRDGELATLNSKLQSVASRRWREFTNCPVDR